MDPPEQDRIAAHDPRTASTFGGAVMRQRVREAVLGHTPQPILIGRFSLQRELGKGGMGTVWLADDGQLERQIALKFLRRAADGETAELRLFAEAQALARLSHPNVVPVYDVGRHQGRVGVAMEYVPGRTLRQWIDEAQPSRPQRLQAWLEAGRGLAAVHAAGLVHRDVKPDNVMKGDDGRVRVIDFGLVRRLGAGQASENRLMPGGEHSGHASESTDGSNDGTPRARRRMTDDRDFMGTLAYAAPEQRFGDLVDARADQFAFCVSVWESLCGSRPDLMQLPTRPGELVPAPAGAPLSRRVRRALSRGLSSDAALRFEGMDALLAALAPRRRRAIVATTVSGIVMGAAGLALGVGAAPVEPLPDPCENTGLPLDQRWGREHRQSLTGRDEAAGAAAVEALDDFATRWRDAAQQACLEVEVEQIRSPRSLDVRRACLERQLDQLDVLVPALMPGNPTAMHQAGAWLAGLGDPNACLEPALLERGDDPIAPEQRQEVSEIRQALFAARLGIGEHALSHRTTRADALLQQAERLGHRGTIGRAHEVRGRLALRSGDSAAARSGFGHALDVATQSGDVALMSDAWLGLAHTALQLGVDLDRADWWLQREEALVARLGDAASARTLLARGRYHDVRGEAQRAESVTRRAIALLEAAGPTSRFSLATALRSLANIVAADGRAGQAVDLHRRATQLELHGPSTASKRDAASRGHKLLGQGMAELGAGDLDAADSTLHLALEVLRTERGPQSLGVATAHNDLAVLFDARGDLAAAREHALAGDLILRQSSQADRAPQYDHSEHAVWGPRYKHRLRARR